MKRIILAAILAASTLALAGNDNGPTTNNNLNQNAPVAAAQSTSAAQGIGVGVGVGVGFGGQGGQGGQGGKGGNATATGGRVTVGDLTSRANATIEKGAVKNTVSPKIDVSPRISNDVSVKPTIKTDVESIAVAETGPVKTGDIVIEGDKIPVQKLQAPGFGVQYAAPSANCALTNGVALSVPGGGGSIGTSHINERCQDLEVARIASAMGFNDQAFRVLCRDKAFSAANPLDCGDAKQNSAPAAAEAKKLTKTAANTNGGRS